MNDHGNPSYKATQLYYNLHSQKRSILELRKFALFRTKKCDRDVSHTQYY